MPGPNEQNALQLTMEQQRQREVLRHVEESKRDEAVKSMFGVDVRLQMDQQSVNAMAQGIEMMQRLNIQQITSDTGAVDIAQLNREKEIMQQDVQKSIQKREESKMKEKEQKKAAAQRFAARTDYRQPEAQQLMAARASYASHAQENPITETDRRNIRINLSKDEFAPDPHTGELDVAGLLEKQRMLSAKVKLYERDKKAGTLNPDEEISLELNKDILKLFSNALKNWFSAGGVDAASGKALSDSKIKSARQELGFALEKYQEFMENLNDNIAQRYLSKFQKDHKKELAEAVKNAAQIDREATSVIGLDLNLPRICKDDITNIRRMTAEHPEKYQENKALVDRIYQEYLATAESYNKQMQPMQQMQKMIQQEQNHNIRTNSGAGIAYNYLEKRMTELSTYQKRLEIQMSALSFLLKGREPDNFINAVFIMQQWGIMTQSVQTAEEDINAFGVVREAILDNAPPGISEGERTIREETVAKYMEVLKRARQEAKGAPEGSAAKENLILVQRGSLNPHISNLQNIVSRFTDERKMRTTQIQRTFGALTFKDKQGKECGMPSDSYTRDTVNMMTPLLEETSCSMEEMVAVQDRVYSLTSGKHLNRSDATVEEKQAALLSEYERIVNTAAEVKAFAETRQDAFRNPDMTHEQRLRLLPLLQETYKKMQTLCYISGRYYELAENDFRSLFSEEQRKELGDAYEIFRCLQDYAYGSVSSVDKRSEPRLKEYTDGLAQAHQKIVSIQEKARQNAS